MTRKGAERRPDQEVRPGASWTDGNVKVPQTTDGIEEVFERLFGTGTKEL